LVQGNFSSLILLAMKKFLLVVFVFVLQISNSHSLLMAQVATTPDTNQEHKVEKARNFKNTIRFNITNPVLLSEKSIIFGYERVIKNHMSFSVNFGYTTLPPMRLGDVNVENEDIQLTNTSTDKGFNFSVDYRFYLNKVNKHVAPRGVYLAPYYSYNHFERVNTWFLTTTNFNGEVITDFTIDIHTIGGELGYQFVLWDRLALDFVLFGPGIASYALKTNLSTTLDADDQSELFQLINDHLEENIPGYSLVIEEGDFVKSGTSKTTDVGFRYMIHLGFRF
jgi:hypothetical protein